jgi:DNA-binding CsgD family transcriptional regulator
MQQPSFAKDDAGIWSAVEALRSATSLSGIGDIARIYARKKGFDHFGFAYKRRASADCGAQLVPVLDLPKPWAARYDDLASGKTSEKDDPLIRHVTTVFTPSSWDWRGRVTFTEPLIARSARRLLGVAAENGLRVGLTIPLTCPRAAWSYLSMTMDNDCSAQDLVPELPFALLLAQSMMIAVRRLVLPAQPSTQPLSLRETEILRWCSAGKSSWAVSRILRLSQSTVNFHIANAMRKLQVTSRQAACAKAISLDLIEL